MNRRQVLDRAVLGAAWLCAALTVASVVAVFAFVAREALPALSPPRGAPPLSALVEPARIAGRGTLYLWQPVGRHPFVNVLPLVVGSLKVASLALALSAPVSVAAACAMAFWLTSRQRRRIKPLVELLAGVPSVVLGYLALSVIAGAVQSLTGCRYRLNATTAAVGVALAVAPWIVTLCDEALRAVPRDLIEGAAALGATRAQTVWRLALPAARQGIAATLLLAFGRAVGETMIVLMASGNAAVLRPLDPTSGARTITATIAAELGEVASGSHHRALLFLLGASLFAFTFALNAAAERVLRAARREL